MSDINSRPVINGALDITRPVETGVVDDRVPLIERLDDRINEVSVELAAGACECDESVGMVPCPACHAYDLLLDCRDALRQWQEFGGGLMTGYDHNEDAHRYNNGACRVCNAQEMLDETKYGIRTVR